MYINCNNKLKGDIDIHNEDINNSIEVLRIIEAAMESDKMGQRIKL